MKLEAADLPEKERDTFLFIQHLPTQEKKTLWKLIRGSNKDHICMVNRLTPSVHALITQGLVTINKSYKQKNQISLFILRKTPHLMKKLQDLGREE
ncbi:hypothetical protein CR194_09600 [Salipaludibacillus keqinensis]|uniref:Uncharacterized protein n=1 Tax=Salipaludibacillus keqinensis TaxID=2045207 RepID=A0A323TEB3_9BACI|nr:hypothetical protein [Salipaludibacillus keqinensis]PYZ93421.1 hypothetical protein CR194_09600 [Salipaludibacillus keqinensis]